MPPYPKCSVSSTLLQPNATSVQLLAACHVPGDCRASHCEAAVGSPVYTSLTAIDGLLFSCYAGGRMGHLCRTSLMHLAVELATHRVGKEVLPSIIWLKYFYYVF